MIPRPADWSSPTEPEGPAPNQTALPVQLRDPGRLRPERRQTDPSAIPRGPQLAPEDTPRVDALYADLSREIRFRELFVDFSPADTLREAQTFVRYRILPLATLRLRVAKPGRCLSKIYAKSKIAAFPKRSWPYNF